jgi:hypothetical protein
MSVQYPLGSHMKVLKRIPVLLMTGVGACGRTAIPEGSMAGCYTFGHEVNVFKPLGGDSVFWVVGPQDVLQRLRSTHDSLTSKPYEQVWARVLAQRSSQEPDGFAVDYSGLLEIQKIVQIRRAAAGECS